MGVFCVVTSTSMSQKSQDTLPGLDLLTPDSIGIPPPPTSFYGSMDNMNGNNNKNSFYELNL